MINILMTGAGAPGGPGILKCLKEIPNSNIIVADANPISAARFLNKDFLLIPSADEKNFITVLLDLCKQFSIDYIFPLVTKELPLFSEFKNNFNSIGTKVIVSDFESLNIANNKSLLYKHLHSLNIKIPEFYVVNTYQDYLKYSIIMLNKYDNFCIKPSISNGSRGVRLVYNELDEYNLLFNLKPGHLFISYDNTKNILKSDDFPELLVSEILPGTEYTVDTLVDLNGQPFLILPRERLKTNGGISTAGRFVNNKIIIDYCIEIIKSLKLFGPIGLQLKISKEGQPLLLEINPRIQGTSVASLGLGLNIPKIFFEYLITNTLPSLNIDWDLNFIRYYDEVFFKS
jgi:carbamoyl-phosphate synthase large subunit